MAMNCNLPSECECELCEYWGENGWDIGRTQSRTPDWQHKQDSDEDGE